MGLLDKLFKTKATQQTASSIVTREAPKVVQPPREPSPAEMMFRHFQAAMSEEDPLRRKEEIAAITEKYWLARLVREGRYEADRVQALQQLKDQNALLANASWRKLESSCNFSEKQQRLRSVFFYHNTNKTEECKMMKKIFVFVMLMVFAFSLTACSGTATPSAEKDSLTVQEWLDNEGSEADTTMTVTIVAIENPVWALVTDSSGAEVHLFGVMVDGEHKAFEEAGISEGDTIVISGGKYNEFEGNVEIAEATLVEIKQ